MLYLRNKKSDKEILTKILDTSNYTINNLSDIKRKNSQEKSLVYAETMKNLQQNIQSLKTQL